jgi:hypothetical protein
VFSILSVILITQIPKFCYTNLSEIKDIRPLNTDSNINKNSPIYYLGSENKSDWLLHLVARIRKTKYRYREFNPYEQTRLGPGEAIEEVSSSAAVIVPLLSNLQTGSQIHNIRAAFVCGLAHGMGKPCLIVQPQGGLVELDVRDLVKMFREESQIDQYIADLLPSVVEGLRQDDLPVPVSEGILSKLDFGQTMAENETGDLKRYYYVTDEFRSVLNGKIRLVIGRKGSGKTAVFMQARDRWQPIKDNVVVDLKPDAYKLRKLRDVVLQYLAEGSRDHLQTFFWEYLLLLEVCGTILEEDYQLHLRDHNLLAPYEELARTYREGHYASGVDFSERMVQLIDRLAEKYEKEFGSGPGQLLTDGQIINLLYEHDMPALRSSLSRYLCLKDAVYILFDNLDKGWSSQGLSSDDITIVRSLVAAADRVDKYFQRSDVESHVIIFLRNDIYEFLVEVTPDRGKEAVVSIDWRDRDLLRIMINRRLVASKIHEVQDFDFLWGQICVPHVHGEASFEYLLDRCLMRPRYLLRILKLCRSVAINREHLKITAEDIDKGLEEFSNDLLADTDNEIRDVLPEAEGIVFNLIHEPWVKSRQDIERLFPQKCHTPKSRDRLFDLLLWFGVYGIFEGEDCTIYIYDTSAGYSLRKLKALVAKTPNALFRINPALEPGLR